MVAERRRCRAALSALLVLLTACSSDVMSPIRNLGEVGVDSYLVFVAQSSEGSSELYVSRPDGRNIRPVTFSPLWESRPTLSPDGAVLAYLRSADTLPATPRMVWVTNLINGAEKKLTLPTPAPAIEQLAWSADGARLVARSAAGEVVSWRMPPSQDAAQRIDGAARDSVLGRFDLLLGDPPFARIMPCVDGQPLACVEVLNDTVRARQPLADFSVRDAVRWRGDSVAYLIGDSLRVRPLGRGRERRIEWAPKTPIDPRQFTLFLGKPRAR